MRDVKLSDLMHMEPIRSHSIPALIEKLLAWYHIRNSPCIHFAKALREKGGKGTPGL